MAYKNDDPCREKVDDNEPLFTLRAQGWPLGLGYRKPESDKPSITYPMPLDGWTCFHCGERFTKPGTARDHFGETPQDSTGCVIKAGEEQGLLMELRRAQARYRSLETRILAALT